MAKYTLPYWPFWPRHAARLFKNREGITTLEFALVAPVILLMILAIVEFALIMFAMAAMESATANTSRLGKTGWAASGISRQQTIINNIQAKTLGLLNPALLTITMTIYPNFNNVGNAEPYTDTNNNGQYTQGEPYTDVNGNAQWDADMGTSGAGDAGDVVLYNVTYPWPVMTPPVKLILGATHNIVVRSVVKNETFD